MQRRNERLTKSLGFTPAVRRQAFPPSDLGYFIASRLRSPSRSLIRKRGETWTRTFRGGITGVTFQPGRDWKFSTCRFMIAHRRRIVVVKKEDVDVENMPVHSRDIKDAKPRRHGDKRSCVYAPWESTDNGMLLHVMQPTCRCLRSAFYAKAARNVCVAVAYLLFI